MINDIKRGLIANCIALHDFRKNAPDLKKWVEYIVGFFNEYGIIPTKMDITGKNGIKGNSNILFKNGIKKLEACNYEGVDGLWIGATPPNHGDDVFDSIFSTHLDLTAVYTASVLCFDNKIVPFEQSIINKLTRDLAELCGAKYGYFYQRAFSKNPGSYPRGIISGLEYGNPEREKIARWGNSYCMPDGSYKICDLRDIYPMNVLSQVHLDRIVLGYRLEDWILQNPSHGTLTKLTDNLWAWWVEENQILHVRDALAPTGIILCI